MMMMMMMMSNSFNPLLWETSLKTNCKGDNCKRLECEVLLKTNGGLVLELSRRPDAVRRCLL